MSRFSKTNDKYEFDFGLDHALGPFFQIWATPAKDHDEPVIKADSTGIYSDPKQAEKSMNRKLARLLMDTDLRFRAAFESGNSRPNLDATTIDLFAEACGFIGLYSEIADALDNPP